MTREGSVLKSPKEEPDERLLIEAAQQDPSRFAELYEKNFDRVYAYIARRVRDRVDVQDLTSHVFHQALANIGKFKWRGAPFAAWLYRIASNAIADHSQRKSREQTLPDPHGSAPQDHAPRGDAFVEDVERSARLFSLVNNLSDDQRRVIRMRFAEDKSIREIAVELGRTEGAIKQLQFRAIENLRAQMGVKHA